MVTWLIRRLIQASFVVLAMTLIVFVGFSTFYLHEPVKLSTLFGFCLIFAGAALVFLKL